MFSNDIAKHKMIPRSELEDHVYLGPDFVSLDEDIQKGLSEYLINNGLDQPTVAFIEVMAMDKEQRLYMKWLQEVNKFIKDGSVL
jgi:complement component 1 Q subcomponent-binding protein